MHSQIDVAIIGAGPFGLSIAAQLRARGVAFRIFGSPMRTWLRMPKTLNLKSFGFATNIYVPEKGYTFPEYCRAHGLEDFEPCSMPSFAEYGLWVQQKLIPEVEPVDIASLDLDPGGFELTLAGNHAPGGGKPFGEKLLARRVVVAVGLTYFARMPPVLQGLPPALASHTFHHADHSRFKGQDVAVIGAGSSALETSAVLHEAGARPQVLIRGPGALFFDKFNPQRTLLERFRAPNTVMGPGRLSWVLEHAPLAAHFLPEAKRVRLVRRHLGPSASWWLKDRVVGKVPLHARCTVLAAEEVGSRLRLRLHEEGKGERTLDVDHVIAGTGFEFDVDRIPFLDGGLLRLLQRVERAPALSRNFESSVPGLYFVGPVSAFSFGPLMRFVAGAEYAAPALARHLARDARRPCARRAWRPATDATATDHFTSP